MASYPKLFEPFRIGNAVFRNRIFASATGHIDYNYDNTLTAEAVAYYERKAIGGAAAVVIGECQINPATGGRGGACIDLSSFSAAKGLCGMAAAISGHGAVASPELQHAGRYGGAALGPSDGDVHGKPCHAMTEEQILKTIDDYAAAAAMAKYCGFGMVTVHGGHGWLPEQFFARWTNERTDRWGGSVENRTRFAVAVCDAIHARCGRDFPVEFRISGTEFDDGYGIDEGVEYAKALNGHADIIHVSVGLHGDLQGLNWLRSYPTMFEDEGKNVRYAAEIKKHIRSSLVATVGALTTPAYLEEVIATGQADIVAIARGLICDPDLPNKARQGREDEIRKCLRCFGCFSNLFPAGKILCALNPESGYETTARQTPPLRKQKLLVAGGGVTGMAAALTAAQLGHDVTLCEKSDRLGGAILCEENVPFKANLRRYLDQQAGALEKAGVRVLLNTPVTPDYAAQGGYDAVFAALGSTAVKPPIPGIDGPTVLDAESAYRDPALVGQRVVILGAGLVGAELAIYLHDLGRSVRVLELAGDIRAEGNSMHGTAVKLAMRERELTVDFQTAAEAIDETGVRTSGGQFFPADTVIYATGRQPRFQEAAALSAAAGGYAILGDCAAPKNIMSATRAAWLAARDLGR